MQSLKKNDDDMCKSRGQQPLLLHIIYVMVDVVQAFWFITKKKSEGLVLRLGTLTSEYNAGYLNREVYIRNRIKTSNDSIYANVDTIHAAIGDNRQIRFCEWTVNKTLVLQQGRQTLYNISLGADLGRRELLYGRL